VQIREAQPGGERQVAEVHVRAWKAAYRRLLPDLPRRCVGQPEYLKPTATTSGDRLASIHRSLVGVVRG
jgi:hypothetical protein